MRWRFSAVLSLCAALTLPVWAAPGSGAEPLLAAGRVGWIRAGLEARKLFLSATTSTEWSMEDRAAVAGQLLKSPEGDAVPPGPRVLRVRYLAELPGTRSDTSLWMDPDTGNSLQYTVRDSGRRTRERTVRFTSTGAWQHTRRPGPGESPGAPATWTDEGSGFWPYGQRLPDTPVLDSLGLLYFIAGSTLAKSGDRLEVLVFQSRELVRVGLAVDGQTETDVDYRATGVDGARRCRGSTKALRVRLTVMPFGAARPDFDFLGLKSDIVILIAPVSRLPLLVEGRAAVVGRVTTRLHDAVLKGNVSCPAGT